MDKIKILMGDDVLVDDGEARLSFYTGEELGGLGKDVFGLTVSNGGGFSTIFCNKEDWIKIKEKVDSYFTKED